MDGEETTVLIVEDERDLADTYARWLADEHAVRTAYSGEEALSAMDDDVDVVLLDRRLPGTTGGEVLEAIRDRGHDCTVALITAVDPDFDILEMPVDDYVVKPVLRADLLEIVDRLVKRAAFDERLQESFALASKLTVLEAEKSTAELEENQEYRRSRARLAELRETIDDTMSAFETEDFASTYRAIGRDPDAGVD